METEKYIFLSHILNESTPLYGGIANIKIKSERSIKAGDSSNNSFLCLPSHAGTHVDAPYHFVVTGKTVDTYTPQSWIFNSPLVVDIPSSPGQLIKAKDLHLQSNRDVDLILFRTGFEKLRSKNIYWEESPGLSADIAPFLLDTYKNLRAVGMDFISISSMKHRQEGREAHQAFLKNGLLIFEDMTLAGVVNEFELYRVIALPLRFEKGEGAPCTILGIIKIDFGVSKAEEKT